MYRRSVRSDIESCRPRELVPLVLPTALQSQKLGQCFVDDSWVDAAVGRVPHAPGGAVVMADHAVLADDESVGRLFLHPVLPVMFAVQHVAALPRLRSDGGRGGDSHGRRRGATGAGGRDRVGARCVGARSGDGGTPRGRGSRRHLLLLHAVHAPVAQHAHRLVHLVVLLRFRVHPFRFHVQPSRIPVVRLRRPLLQQAVIRRQR